MTQSDYVAELRVYDLAHYFKEWYWELRDRIRSGYFALLQSQLMSEIVSLTVGVAVLLSILGWMVYQTLEGMVSTGALSMFYVAFTQAQRIMRTMLGNIGELYRNILFLENLFDFLAIDTDKPTGEGKMASSPYEIVFDRVRFRYPDSDRLSLEELSLTLTAGKTTAIVGTNGAGKSTLIKLLCRFYEPESGEIRINGIPLRQIDSHELRKKIAVLFQKFVQYHLSVKENIALGNIDSSDIHAIHQAAIFAGVDETVRSLEEGYNTVLGKWFGGSELSGGEWQKIALARAYMKDASIIILDEPTSAMDSWAEADWMDRFREMCQGKTALIITHRFTTARHADYIYVMDHGRVVETGTHDELISQEGLYAESWVKQTQEYFGGKQP